MKVNVNTLHCELLADILYAHDVAEIVISPGSRSTPLTLTFAADKRFITNVIIDERSAAFYASGLARAGKRPVALVCTSGTAAVEYYPAIVEAFQQRIPLIVCTADRPAYLVDTGANQTIRQAGLYRNHIRAEYNFPLPQLNESAIRRYISSAQLTLRKGLLENRGPVHFNLPFEKPFEPDTFTGIITNDVYNRLKKRCLAQPRSKALKRAEVKDILSVIGNARKPLILCGPGEYSSSFNRKLQEAIEALQVPVFADIGSGLRTAGIESDYLLTNYHHLLKSVKKDKRIEPDVIIQFGRFPVSSGVEGLCKAVACTRIMVNEFADVVNPTKGSNVVCRMHPQDFLDALLKFGQTPVRDASYLLLLTEAEKKLSERRRNHCKVTKAINEPAVIASLFELMPDGSALMLSNSLTYRDFDNFSPVVNKKVAVYQNRGTSGIDGIISTAAGIAGYFEHTFLAIGDVAFYYDLNALLILKKYKLPVTILLFNNDGGRIFDTLPVNRYKETLTEYFSTPPGIAFKPIIESFGGHYKAVTGIKQFKSALNKMPADTTFRVIDIKLHAKESEEIRKTFREKVI